jgi:hypothetical protein
MSSFAPILPLQNAKGGENVQIQPAMFLPTSYDRGSVVFLGKGSSITTNPRFGNILDSVKEEWDLLMSTNQPRYLRRSKEQALLERIYSEWTQDAWNVFASKKTKQILNKTETFKYDLHAKIKNYYRSRKQEKTSQVVEETKPTILNVAQHSKINHNVQACNEEIIKDRKKDEDHQATRIPVRSVSKRFEEKVARTLENITRETRVPKNHKEAKNNDSRVRKLIDEITTRSEVMALAVTPHDWDSENEWAPSKFLNRNVRPKTSH